MPQPSTPGPLENFELGAAGIWDAMTGGHSAAGVYAQQQGTSPANVQQLDQAASAAEDGGALSQAAAQTETQVAADPFGTTLGAGVGTVTEAGTKAATSVLNGAAQGIGSALGLPAGVIKFAIIGGAALWVASEVYKFAVAKRWLIGKA